ncbi:MAG: EAL domain-containing protein [Gammaproteobacteria bacterium]|nr:EAL domain-containing protein [Gammaproteobacteria bacterium]MBQ0839154.1 EAL domain-containing protein [Gammaproteobacteria bacterium]
MLKHTGKKLLNLQFSQQLIIIFTIAVILMSTLVSYAVGRTSNNILKQQMRAQGLQITQTFTSQSKLALLYMSEYAAQDAVKSIAGFPDIEVIRLQAADGTVLYNSREIHKNTTEATIDTGSAIKVFEDESEWIFSAPVFSEAGFDEEFTDIYQDTQEVDTLLGYVTLSMSKKTLHLMQRGTYQTSFIVTFAIAILIIVTLFRISRRVTRPVEQLALVMGQAEQGNTAIRATLEGQPDVAKMQHAFNAMMDGIESREDELQSAHDKALETARVKGEFVANVTHELRTPLNAVLGMMDLLSETRLNTRQTEYIDIAKNSGENLLELIEDILDFSKMESGNMDIHLKDVDIRDLAEEVIQLLSAQALSKKLNFGYDIEDNTASNLVSIDTTKVRQVLINLLGNAIKFTDSGEVFLRIRYKRGPQPEIEFEIRDTGIGIKENSQLSIFDAFTQADSSTTKAYTGTGLGLTICKQIIELMNGTIALHSVPGKGSTFTFNIPVEHITTAADANTGLSLDEQGHALLITSSVIVRLFTTLAIQKNDFLCITTGSLRAAQLEITRLEKSGINFELIVVDEEIYYLHENEFLTLLSKLAATQSATIAILINPYRPLKLKSHRFLSIEKPLLRSSFEQLIDIKNNPQTDSPQQQIIRATKKVSSTEINQYVLIVDDNRVNQQVAREMLNKLGYRSDIAINGQDAVSKSLRKNYDLILMDCNMPVMDGYEATREIRKRGGEKYLPIIAMSANTSDEDAEKCLLAGMDGTIGKPLRLNKLRDELISWMSDSQAIIEEQAPAAEQVRKAEEIEVLAYDPQVMEDLFEGIGDVVIKMLEAFLEDSPIYIDSLKQALQRGSSKNVRELAHTLKGSASNFGAINFLETARIIEHLANNHQLHQCDIYIEALVDDFDILKRDIENKILNPLSNAEEIHQRKHKLLIVDDDRTIRLALKNIFTEQNFLIFEARNGQQAISFCKQDNPDLILMDAIMPEVDGFEACKTIRALPSFSETPILMITSLEDNEAINKAFTAGATDYITKPLNFTVLKERVSRLLQANRVEKRVKELAYHDSLTGLPNRSKLMQELRLILNRAKLDNSQFAVLFLDLDHFKNINDSLGHNIGDLLLKAVADRLQSAVRESDFVARLGGDEFTVILENIEGDEAISTIAQNICSSLSSPFVFIQQKMFVTASVGISVYPDDGDDVNALLKHADLAMFSAKKSRNNYSFYQQGMEDKVARRLELEQELRHAISHEQLVLYYQPQFDLKSNKVTAAETLIRWEHPTHGFMSPMEFIPLAEETGLIKDLTFWVIRHAFEQIAEWQKQHFDVKLSVNLSAKDLETPGALSDFLTYQLEKTGVSPALIELELTESMLMDDPEKSRKELLALKDMGFVLAIDDFGTGYSSLNYLKNLPVDILKIDRSFIKEIEINPDDKPIVKGIIALADSLGLKTIAEGVENEQQQTIVHELGCDTIQGYFISRPLPREEFERSYLNEFKVRGKSHRKKQRDKPVTNDPDNSRR